MNSLDRLARIQAAGLAQDDFKIWGKVYAFICEYSQEHHGAPPAELIKQKWPDWEPPVGEFEYWLAEFIRHAAAFKAESLIRESIPGIEKFPDTAIPELITRLSAIQYHGNSHIVATDTGASERLSKYLARKKVWEDSGGSFLWGIPTGLDILDKTHQGWMDGELIGFYARPTVGKTWMLIREAVIAWASGYRVLLISPEVSARHVALRIDVFMARALGITISHKKIFEGHPDQAELYQAATQAIGQHERWWTVDSLQGRPLGLRDLRALAQQFEPDMILIDGVMLLEDDKRAREGWQKMENICYGLKNFATAMDIVIMISHQAVNLSKGRRNIGALGRGDDFVMPTLNDASGGEAFVRACTTVFTMAPDTKHTNLRWYSLRKTRERQIEEWKPRYALGWNVDRGNIEDLSRYGEDMLVIEKILQEKF